MGSLILSYRCGRWERSRRSSFDLYLIPFKKAAGIAGCHGGMGDSFRNEVEYQYMVGGQWVAHPGNDGVRYDVNMKDRRTIRLQRASAISSRLGKVLHACGSSDQRACDYDFGDVKMPVVWTKTWGQGRVYYNSLGHQATSLRCRKHLN